jgi:hypothetical protein
MVHFVRASPQWREMHPFRRAAPQDHDTGFSGRMADPAASDAARRRTVRTLGRAFNFSPRLSFILRQDGTATVNRTCASGARLLSVAAI